VFQVHSGESHEGRKCQAGLKRQICRKTIKWGGNHYLPTIRTGVKEDITDIMVYRKKDYMSLSSFIKKNLRDYFIIVTGINVAMAILGLNFEANKTIGYEAFFSPLIIGAIAVLPSVVMYSTKELSLRQMLLRRGVHLAVLELTLTVFGFLAGFFADITLLLPFIVTVLLVYVFTLVFRWILDNRTAKEINKGLRRLQESE
jgi:hypothetical protein